MTKETESVMRMLDISAESVKDDIPKLFERIRKATDAAEDEFNRSYPKDTNSSETLDTPEGRECAGAILPYHASTVGELVSAALAFMNAATALQIVHASIATVLMGVVAAQTDEE